MVGYAFMGAAHSQAWRTVNRVFDLPSRARMVAVCGRDAGKVSRGGARGSAGTRRSPTGARWSTGRRHRPHRHLYAGRQPRRDRHRRAGRRQARAVREAAGQHGGRGARRWPPPPPRRGPRGRAGDVRVQLPPGAGGRADAPTSSRPAGSARSGTCGRCTCRTGSPTRSSRWCGGCSGSGPGSGALGDIGAHIIDLTQFVTGQHITGVSALTETFVTERPLPAEADGGPRPPPAGDGRRHRTGHSGRCRAVRGPALRRRGGHLRGDPVRHRPQERAAGGGQRLARLARVRPGAAQRAGVLRRHRARPRSRASARILVTEPDHPYLSAWWPPGHIIGYEHSFTHQVRDLIEAIGGRHRPASVFADALQVQHVLDAVERSAAAGSAGRPSDHPSAAT